MALPVRAVIAGFPVVYFGTAPGTDSDRILRFRRKGKKLQLFGGGGWSGSDQIPDHLRDPGDERICGKRPLLDLEQGIFPVSSHRGGFEGDRNDGDKIFSFCSGNEAFPFSLYIAAADQGFDDPGTGGRSP